MMEENLFFSDRLFGSKLGRTFPLCLILILALVGCPRNGDKPDNGNDKPEEPLGLLWSYQYDISGYPQIAPVVIGDSLVIMTGDPSLTCLRASNGDIKWTYPLSGNISLKAKRVFYDDLRIYGNHGDTVKVWDINTGNEEWEYPLNETISRYNSITGQFYYIGSSNDTTGYYSRFTKEGDLNYRRAISGHPWTVLANDDKIIVARGWSTVGPVEHGVITCYSETSGDSLWSFYTELGGFYRGAVFAENGVLYAGTIYDDGVFVALDTSTGEKLWQMDGIWTYHAVVAGNYIYGNTGGSVFKLDKYSGELVWETSMQAGHSEDNLAYLDGYIYHPHGVGMRVVDAETGEIVHVEWPPGGSYFWHVAVSSDRVFAQSSGYLYCYEPFDPEALTEE